MYTYIYIYMCILYTYIYIYTHNNITHNAAERSHQYLKYFQKCNRKNKRDNELKFTL